MNRLRQVSVNHVEASDAPASISTRISFSIPRMESANLGEASERKRANVSVGVKIIEDKKKEEAINPFTPPNPKPPPPRIERQTCLPTCAEGGRLANTRRKKPQLSNLTQISQHPGKPASPSIYWRRERAGIISIICLVLSPPSHSPLQPF